MRKLFARSSLLSMWLAGFLLALGFVPQSNEALAQSATCPKPRILFVLDKSGSMSWLPGSNVRPVPPQKSRWQIVREGLTRATRLYDGQVEYGLEYFTSSASIAVRLATTSGPIIASLNSNNPSGGTVFVVAMRAARNEVIRAINADQAAGIRGRTYAILFITDGVGGTCPVNEVSQLRNLTIGGTLYDVKTYAVGLQGADLTCLNQMATFGGTRTYFADVPASMDAAMKDVIRRTTAEVCNGLDDDCDGRVDNIKNTTRPITQACYTGPAGSDGRGICKKGTQTCTRARWGSCVGQVTPKAETCNGRDDDCDGGIDENLIRNCYSGPAGTSGRGDCRGGRQTCSRGRWGSCVGQVLPKKETCNGRDDDCDGSVDEGNPGGGAACVTGRPGICAPGRFFCTTGRLVCAQTQQPSLEVCDGKDNDCDGNIDENLARNCYSGPTGTSGRGDCRGGRQTCSRGRWGSCVGQVLPKKETCDGKDNDCDGSVDEGNPGGGATCVTGRPGICAPGRFFCTSGRLVCTSNQQPGQEICDGKDNDCDGDKDEGCQCTDGDTRKCGTDEGLCSKGTQTCRNGQWGTCVGGVGPSLEKCDKKDNDCNGTIDDGCNCVDGTTQVCGTNTGLCKEGTQTCVNGNWGACQGNIGPAAEICDGKDNDCNGTKDDGCQCINGATQPCGSNTGACTRGQQTCVNGLWGPCLNGVLPAPEACDGKDNNCDGKVDEGYRLGEACTVGQGACENKGKTVCSANAVGVVCSAKPGTPTKETCNGKDDDCDGNIDEDFLIGQECTVGVGLCKSKGQNICKSDGSGATCNVKPAAPRKEVCDGEDNDCDGQTDEDFPIGQICTSGVGACETQGRFKCRQDKTGIVCSATAKNPQKEVCNGQDDNCDGIVDEKVQCPKPQQICVQGTCINRPKCQVDVDCLGNQVCQKGFCVPPGCYTTTPKCPKNGDLCLQTTCGGDPCATNNCKSDEFCRATDGKCVKSCATVRCSSGQKCEDGACVSDPCASVKCAVGQVCIAGKCSTDRCAFQSACKYDRVCENNACVDDPCLRVKCPANKQVCIAGQCQPPAQCQVDDDCPATNLCVKGKCIVPTCQKTTDCKTNELCLDGVCTPDPCLKKKCPAAQFCRQGQCIDTCAGVFCKTGEKCVEGKCISDPCATVKCAAGTICINGKCEKDKCKKDSCKQARVCVQTPECTEDPCYGVKCPSGQKCDAGQCVGDRPCKVDRECPGDGVCLSGKCSPPSCYDSGNSCQDGSWCSQATCTPDPCAKISCKNGQFCNPKDGKCTTPCNKCAAGERCNNGKCEADPCANKQCQAGETCQEGNCVKDLCSDTTQKHCKYTRVCKNNKCEDNPCTRIQCPSGQSCTNGFCQGEIPCQVDRECPSDLVCINNICRDPNCYTSQCAKDKVCLQAKCGDDPCAGVSCSQGQFCNPKDGKCTTPCPKCATGQRCNASTGKCEPDPCDGKQCPSGESCVEGQCIKDICADTSQSHCRHGRVCESSKCEDDPCANVKCPQGQTCSKGFCEGDIPCKVDADCPGDSICNSGKCGDPNCYTSQCEEGKVCILGECKEDPCAKVNCNLGEFCNPKTGQCVPSCPQCKKGEICKEGKCVADPCDGVKCKEGERCNDQGQCVKDVCSDTSKKQCKHGRVCQDDKCQDDPCLGVKCEKGQQCFKGTCAGEVPCTLDKDCPSDFVCIQKVCKPPACYTSQCADGKFCSQSNCEDNPCGSVQCDSGQYCRPTDGKCVATCPKCKEGEICKDGKCEKDPCAGVKCEEGETCYDGKCEEDKCANGEQENCRHGRVCKRSQCEDDPCAGVQCADNQQCVNGQCTGDTPCKLDRQCPGDFVCIDEVCKDPACYTAKCEGENLCLQGECKASPCEGKCNDGDFCRPSDGQCVPACVKCADGEICSEGKCIVDPCAGVECKEGERCDAGNCVQDLCADTSQKHCRHGRVCLNNKCIDDLCLGVKCGEGQQCVNGACSGAVPCKVDRECPQGLVCLSGVCKAPGCYASECSKGTNCDQGECKDNSCKDKQCAEDEYCRAGTCYAVCPKCEDGQRCRDGKCESDPCAGVQCNDGELCNEGTCEEDLCADRTQVHCRYDRVCKGNACIDDPCAAVECTGDTQCVEGNCESKKPGFQDVIAAGGCGCSTSNEQSGNSAFLLLLLFVVAIRRREGRWTLRR